MPKIELQLADEGKMHRAGAALVGHMTIICREDQSKVIYKVGC